MSEYMNWTGRQEHHTDQVTQGMLIRFHATVGRDAGLPDDIAPIGFHWCLCLPKALMEDLSADGHPTKGDFLPPVPSPRRMWAASKVQFHEPIRSDACIERISTIASITEKQGKTGLLVFVDVDHKTSVDGVLAVRETQSIVYREAATAQMQLPADHGADLSDWPVTRAIVPDSPLLFRYSALTFNTHRIHYDADYTVNTEGYPGLVVHGPLMATLLMRLAVKELGPEEVGGFSFRAKSPAFVGQKLYLAARLEGDGLALAAIGADGRIVMDATVTRRQ